MANTLEKSGLLDGASMNKDLNPSDEFIESVEDAVFEALRQGQDIRGLSSDQERLLSNLYGDYRCD